jgi:hypothetical protein
MLTSGAPLAFDGRDVTDQPVPDAVLGYGLLTCPYCGATRDVQFPFCCEFAAEPAPRPLVAV